MKIANYLEVNGNASIKILWEAAKAVPRNKAIVIKTFIKKQGVLKTDGLSIQLK